MKVSAEKLEGSKVVLTVEAPSSVVDESLDKAYKSVVKRINVPGFRRGKAPRMILERYFGKEVLYDEAMKEVLPGQYEAAVEEAKIIPVGEPEFDEVDFSQGKPLTFKATVYVRPDVTLADYEDLSVPFESQVVTDEDVESQVSFLRDRMTQLEPLADDQVLGQGDYATCHVKGIEGGSKKVDLDQDLSYVEAGKEYGIVPGLSQALLGMKKGETKEFTGAYPAKEGEEVKEARFSVEVKDCYKKRPPSDEDFLKNYAKDSMDAAKADIRQRLESLRKDTAKRAHSQKVEEAIVAKGSVEIPEVMIERREQDLLRRLAERLQEAGSGLDAYMKSTGKSVDDLRNEVRADAEKDVRRDLVLDAVAEKEGIEVSEETMASVVQSFARQAGTDVETMKTTLKFKGAMDSIGNELRRFETMKILAVRAAEKAGTPLPLDEVKAETSASGPNAEQDGEPEVPSQAEEPKSPEAKIEAAAPLAEEEVREAGSQVAEDKAAPKRKKKTATADGSLSGQ